MNKHARKWNVPYEITLPDAGSGRVRLLQCCQRMADWKQITARIRRARTSKDPAGQLSNLFEKTRDAMVAFELARYFESSSQNAEAAKWYATAADRFRRSDWKTKAQESAIRLGAELASVNPSTSADEFLLTPPSPEPTEPALPFEQNTSAIDLASAASSESFSSGKSSSVPSAGGAVPQDKRRRRGRRGGRNRRKGEPAGEPSTTQSPRSSGAPATRRGLPPAVFTESVEPKPPRVTDSRAIPQLPVEPIADAVGPGVRGRSGDPGLSSRLSLLEMQLRRLLTCAPVKLNDADHAPVGPGVFVLTDSDLTSYYYVEACQTLRIAIANLLRGGASRRGADSLKPQLAEHLGIPESRVTKYLADHCVVRWLQLDEGASHFAHFVIAVIRPTLNE